MYHSTTGLTMEGLFGNTSPWKAQFWKLGCLTNSKLSNSKTWKHKDIVPTCTYQKLLQDFRWKIDFSSSNTLTSVQQARIITSIMKN